MVLLWCKDLLIPWFLTTSRSSGIRRLRVIANMTSDNPKDVVIMDDDDDDEDDGMAQPIN